MPPTLKATTRRLNCIKKRGRGGGGVHNYIQIQYPVKFNTEFEEHVNTLL
jgi:hypothetical protein